MVQLKIFYISCELLPGQVSDDWSAKIKGNPLRQVSIVIQVVTQVFPNCNPCNTRLKRSLATNAILLNNSQIIYTTLLMILIQDKDKFWSQSLMLSKQEPFHVVLIDIHYTLFVLDLHLMFQVESYSVLFLFMLYPLP